MEGGRSQAAVFGKGCPWAQPLAAGGVSAARRNSGAHLEMAQRQRGSPKPFCGIEETKLDSEKGSGTFSCVPVRLCVCSPTCAHACVCVHPHVVTGLLSAFCFTRARQSRQQQRQQLPTQRPDTHTHVHTRTHTLSPFLSSSLNCAVICFCMRALAPGSWYFGVRYFQPGSH